MTKTEVKNFREDFQKAITQLQKQYGVNISTGTIRFTDNELRFKVIAKKGEVTKKLTKGDFKLGDIVTINHKRIAPSRKFKVTKIMTKNIQVEGIDQVGTFTVSPHLLQK